MEKCVELADIDNALTCEDADNMGGLVPKLIYGYWDDVETWPDFPVKPASGMLSLEEAGAWDGDLVMKAGTRAYEMEFTEDNGSLAITDQGEIGGESYLYDLTIISAKMRKAIFGFENATKGRRMFFIVQDNNGVRHLMGDKRNGAKKISGDGSTSGNNPTERNQVSLHYTYNALRKLIYEGDTENILKVTPEP